MKSWVRVEMHGRQPRLVFDGYFEGEDGEEVVNIDKKACLTEGGLDVLNQ